MINLRGVGSVLRFELLRSIGMSRFALWLVLAVFPAAIVKLMLLGDVNLNALEFGLPLMVLIPQVMCLLGLLLWATPLVHSELEGKTWIYLAVRPGGKTALLLGKYLTAVIWTALACWLGLTFVVAIAVQHAAVNEPLRLWIAFAVLIGFASFGYGALYVLIGAIFHRRAMVVAVAYTVISEFSITLIPAVINQLTFAYHFRCLLVTWMDWKIPAETRPLFFGDEPAWQHMLTLLGITLALLITAGVVLHKREYLTTPET